MTEPSTSVHVLPSPLQTAQLSKRLSDSIRPSQPTGYTNKRSHFTVSQSFVSSTTSWRQAHDEPSRPGDTKVNKTWSKRQCKIEPKCMLKARVQTAFEFESLAESSCL